VEEFPFSYHQTPNNHIKGIFTIGPVSNSDNDTQYLQNIEIEDFDQQNFCLDKMFNDNSHRSSR